MSNERIYLNDRDARWSGSAEIAIAYLESEGWQLDSDLRWFHPEDKTPSGKAADAMLHLMDNHNHPGYMSSTTAADTLIRPNEPKLEDVEMPSSPKEEIASALSRVLEGTEFAVATTEEVEQLFASVEHEQLSDPDNQKSEALILREMLKDAIMLLEHKDEDGDLPREAKYSSLNQLKLGLVKLDARIDKDDGEWFKSNTYNFAVNELEAAGWYGKDADYCDLMPKAVLSLLRQFKEEGHSGYSSSIAIGLFSRLARYKALTPLTGEDCEWTEVQDDRDEAGNVIGTVYQNKRCPTVFKGSDGRAYNVDGIVFEEPTGSKYTNSDSRVYIEFPYVPETKFVKVDVNGKPLSQQT